MTKPMRLSVLLSMLLASLLLVTCGEPPLKDVNGDGKDDGVAATTVIAPSNPTGTVTGMVLDAATGVPLPEGRSFTVRLVAGGYGGSTLGQQQVISDGSGQFRFTEVPAGVGITVVISGDGYATAYATVQLNAEVGNFPSANAHVAVPPIELIELSGHVDVMVLAPDGRAVAGADVFIDTDFAYFLGGTAVGRVHAAAQTDADGRAALTGLPNAAVLAYRIPNRSFIVTVPPPDIDGDDLPDYTGAISSFTVATAAVEVAPLTVVVGFPTGDLPLRVVASNLADLVNPAASSPKPVPTPSVLPKTGNVTIAFNQPVEVDSFLFRLVGETGGNFIGPTSYDESAFNAYRNVVTIPLPGSLQAGQEYNAYIEARPAQLGSGGAYRGGVAFFIEPTTESVVVSLVRHEERTYNNIIEGGDYIWFLLDVPVGARKDDGTAATAADLLPVRIQVSGIDVQTGNATSSGTADHPMEFGYTGEELPPRADLVEVVPQGAAYVASGYTTQLRLTLPAGVILQPNTTVTWVFKFNDPVGASAAQRYRAATPLGVLPEVQNKVATLIQDPNSTTTDTN
ncbi:MAG: hypothetical protein ABIJ09_03115 [Pseudomonadota bacterium]